eukprot:TRINITY_DN8689_c0_g1_i1.p1 TRINITY_DN8689_c0_g1~~TRINITY_DN8689_c0_g1_i1.p1  ORF type:complete len:215 (+),score=11.10 TRINITY_DN8689_c0_g1_i1:3-647(+)
MGQEASVPKEIPHIDTETLETSKALKVHYNPSIPQRKVRLVLISDTHGYHSQLVVPDGDVLIHTGDFSDFWISGVHGRSFNEWLGTLPHKYKICISGNHDYFLNPSDVEENKKCLSNATHYLQDSGAIIEGLKFWGTPWHIHRNSITRFANNFGIEDQEILEKWKQIPTGTDVLLTHFPPLGVATFLIYLPSLRTVLSVSLVSAFLLLTSIPFR